MDQSKLYIAFFIGILFFGYGCVHESQQIAISSDGLNIRFEKKGDGKPAVVFVHGWCNDKSIWDEQVIFFSEKYTAIAVDLGGFGNSGNERDKWTMSSFGDDVVAVIDHLNLKQVVLVGFSMGGPVVIEAANKIPARILGIVLVDNLQDVEMKYSPEMANYLDSAYMDFVTFPTPEKLEGLFYKENPDASFKRIAEMLKDGPRPSWLGSLHENIRWNNEDRNVLLEKIKMPVVAINSDQQPTNVEAFRNYVPAFEAKIIPGTGHLIFWDKPEEFSRILEETIQKFSGNSQ